MTTEEKARAYDEAMNKVKPLYEQAKKDGNSIWSTYEYLIPELAESEDERIRKEIIKFIQDFCNPCDTDCDKWIAYLEKQKEPKHYWKPTETDVALFNKAVTTNKALTPAEMAQLDIIRSKFGCCRAVNCSGIVQKEQKPSLCDECKKKSTCLDTKYGDDRVVEQCINFVKMKPAEWSEEDETRLTNTLIMLKEYAIHHYSKDDVEKSVDWLENRVKFLRPQPKQEWSKEDEKIIDTIVSVLGQYIDYKAVSGTGSGYATPRYSKEIDWLNSLSLNFKKKNEDVAKLYFNEWSKEDEDTINLMIAILRENHPNSQFKTNPVNNTCMSAISTDMLIKRIESLRPQYHGDVTMTEAYKMGKEAGEASSWKPSEAQLMALHSVIDDESDTIGNEQLKLLYRDLNKL